MSGSTGNTLSNNDIRQALTESLSSVLPHVKFHSMAFGTLWDDFRPFQGYYSRPGYLSFLRLFAAGFIAYHAVLISSVPLFVAATLLIVVTVPFLRRLPLDFLRYWRVYDRLPTWLQAVVKTIDGLALVRAVYWVLGVSSVFDAKDLAHDGGMKSNLFVNSDSSRRSVSSVSSGSRASTGDELRGPDAASSSGEQYGTSAKAGRNGETHAENGSLHGQDGQEGVTGSSHTASEGDVYLGGLPTSNRSEGDLFATSERTASYQSLEDVARSRTGSTDSLGERTPKSPLRAGVTLIGNALVRVFSPGSGTSELDTYDESATREGQVSDGENVTSSRSDENDVNWTVVPTPGNTPSTSAEYRRPGSSAGGVGQTLSPVNSVDELNTGAEISGNSNDGRSPGL